MMAKACRVSHPDSECAYMQKNVSAHCNHHAHQCMRLQVIWIRGNEIPSFVLDLLPNSANMCLLTITTRLPYCVCILNVSPGMWSASFAAPSSGIRFRLRPHRCSASYLRCRTFVVAIHVKSVQCKLNRVDQCCHQASCHSG